VKTIRIALPILFAAAAVCPAQTNTADHFMGLGATFFDTLSVAGGQVGHKRRYQRQAARLRGNGTRWRHLLISSGSVSPASSWRVRSGPESILLELEQGGTGLDR